MNSLFHLADRSGRPATAGIGEHSENSRRSRSGRQLVLVTCGLALAALSLSALGRVSDAAAVEAGDKEAHDADLELVDPATPFTPRVARTPAEKDRIEALALFSAGRMAEQKQDYAQALRFYQRALRHDPDAIAVLREIVPLAFNLDRSAEAVRYALLAAEKGPTDPVLLRRLALHLSQTGDWQRAIRLYEKALAISTQQSKATDVMLSMEVGRLYYLTKQYQLASDRFDLVRKALDDPKSFGMDETLRKAILDEGELTYQLFGETFLEAGRIADAESAFKKSHELKANETQLAFNLARVAAKGQKSEEALQRLNEYFAKRGADEGTVPYEMLATLLQAAGQSDRLIERLVELRSADPENVALGYYLARSCQKAGKLDQAEQIYGEILANAAKQAPLDVYQSLADIYRLQSKPEAALKVLGKAAARGGDFSSFEQQANPLAEDPSFVAAVLASGAHQMASGPDKLDFGERLALGWFALRAKKFDEVRKYVLLAIAAEPKKAADLLSNAGLELFLAGQQQAAVELLERGIVAASAPAQKAALHFYLAGALEMLGKTDEAVSHAETAVQLQADSPRFQSRRGWVLYHAKRHDQARKAYEDLIAKFDSVYDPPETRDVLKDARLVLSNIEVHENKLPKAEEWLEQVLDEFPEDIGALNDLGYLWADQGKRLHAALRMIQRAVAEDPKNLAYRDSLGWVLYRLGHYDESVTQLKIAAADEDADGVILDHLGDALSKGAHRAAAIDAWSKAAQAFKKQADTAKFELVEQKLAGARKDHAAVQPAK